MKIIFLGTGTSVGTPVIACNCEVCKSNDKRDFRFRTSLYIEHENAKIVIDCGPDFRLQMLNNNIKDIDAVFFTHKHRDHTAGIDDIRPFNFMLNKAVDVIANNETIEVIKASNKYIFDKIYKDAPCLNIIEIENKEFEYKGIKINPISVLHANETVFGYRIAGLTYITDANYISETELQKAKNSDVLILNSLARYKHRSHFSLDESLQIVEQVKPKIAYLTHISHGMGLHAQTQSELPENVFLAYDGLIIEI